MKREYTDSRSLAYTHHLLTVKNTINRYSATGPTAPGTRVTCLRPNSFGYHMPCLATIVKTHASGRFTVALWDDQSDIVTVSSKAVVWAI